MRSARSHWVPPGTGGCSGGSVTPPPDAEQRGTLRHPLFSLSYLFFPLRDSWGFFGFVFFPSFPEHHAGSGNAVSRSSESLHSAAWSAEFANLGLLSRSRETEPVQGQGDPCQPRGVPGPRRAAGGEPGQRPRSIHRRHGSCPRAAPPSLAPFSCSLALPGTGRAPGGRGCPKAVT